MVAIGEEEEKGNSKNQRDIYTLGIVNAQSSKMATRVTHYDNQRMRSKIRICDDSWITDTKSCQSGNERSGEWVEEGRDCRELVVEGVDNGEKEGWDKQCMFKCVTGVKVWRLDGLVAVGDESLMMLSFEDDIDTHRLERVDTVNSINTELTRLSELHLDRLSETAMSRSVDSSWVLDRLT
nr:hypothetical protein [Tanacetum cinerariifolium]